MIDLQSPEWHSILANPGGTGALTAQLLRQVIEGDLNAYDELYHQVCHQFTVGVVAYAAVPHLVQIARHADPQHRIRALSIVGTVAAALGAYPRSAALLPEQWRVEYLAANAEALVLAAESLRQSGLDMSDAQELIATVAALHGHTDLAMLLFLQGGSPEFSCPECGEPITWKEPADS